MKKTKKLLLLFAGILSLMCIMALAVSAKAYHVGDEIPYPTSGKSNQYGVYESLHISDESVAVYTTDYKIRFIKTGYVTISVYWELSNSDSSVAESGTVDFKYVVSEPNTTAVSNITVSGLTAPYHNGPLDQTGSVSYGASLVNVQYLMFNKELDSYSRGDRISVVTRVKTDGTGYVFDPNARAYWSEVGVYSDKTTLISPTEAEFTFYYTVGTIDSQILNTVNLSVAAPAAGRPVSLAAASSATQGITVDSVTWTPADTRFTAGTIYAVEIKFSPSGIYLLADDFETNGRVTINGLSARVRCERSNVGKFTNTEYYAVYTFPRLQGKTPSFTLTAVGETDLQIYEADKPFTLQAAAVGIGSTIPDFRWYRCDKDGVTLPAYPQPLGMSAALTVSAGIPNSEMLQTQYYRCDAAIDNTVKSKIFSVTLCPMGVEYDYDIPFTDVTYEDYFAPAVAWAYENGVTAGTGDGTTFSPDLTCTRGQVVTFLWRAAGCPEPKSMDNPFTDVKSGDWFCKPVLWAVEQKITQGTSAVTFSPERECSTAEILTFLFRAVGAGTNGYYEEAANWAEGLGLLTDTGLAVNPTTPCPRKAIVTYLHRIYGK